MTDTPKRTVALTLAALLALAACDEAGDADVVEGEGDAVIVTPEAETPADG